MHLRMGAKPLNVSLWLGKTDCKRLAYLPESLDGLCALEKLELDGCVALKRLPTSITLLQRISSFSGANLQDTVDGFGKEIKSLPS